MYVPIVGRTSLSFAIVLASKRGSLLMAIAKHLIQGGTPIKVLQVCAKSLKIRH